jgi:hypothetical protein
VVREPPPLPVVGVAPTTPEEYRRAVAVLQQRDSGRRVTLPARCLVGRARTCDLVLDEGTVSGEHAVFQWTGAAWELRDLGSRNGTFVDSQRLGSDGRRLDAGVSVRFGRDTRTWTLVDDGAPQLMAIDLQTGALRGAEGGYLALPDTNAAELCVYQDPRGVWVVEAGGTLDGLDDRAVLSTSDGARWQVHLPTALPGTDKAIDTAVPVASLQLCFTVSRDEEHVVLVARAGERCLDLQSRAHHYPLLVLARRRLADRTAGLADGEQGWVYQDELTRLLRMDDNHLNISIHRARAQLGRLGVHDAASLVERRAGSRQLRIGPRHLEIVTT